MTAKAPSCQFVPVTKNSSEAAAAPVHANAPSSRFLWRVRSAIAPMGGRTIAESTVEKVMMYDGSAPGATGMSPSTWTRPSTAASFAIAIRYGAKSTVVTVVT